MGIGVESRKDNNSIARTDLLRTVVEFLAEEPWINDMRRADTLIDGFLWSEETHEVVKEAAAKVYKIIHREEPSWSKSK